MKKGKKYSKDGVQYAMYPNPIMNITQSINGSYSHQGTNAIDDAQENTSISKGYAFADVKCVATDYKNGNFMFWQTEKPVKTVKYGVTHLTFMVGHDNTANAYVGMKIKQGEQLFEEGTAGMATGNHNHIEVAIGKFKSMYVLNKYGVYMLPNCVNPADVFFVDDTKIINGGGLKWKKIKDVSDEKPSKPSSGTILNSIPSDFVRETATFYPNTTIKIRKAPSLQGVDTGLVYEKGLSVIYDGYVKREGYVWISWISASAGERRWMAAGELNSKGVNVNLYGSFR